MSKPAPKLVMTLRRRKQEIEREAQREFGIVVSLVADRVGLVAQHPEHRRVLRLLWRRHAMNLPPGWFTAFVRHCLGQAAQNRPFYLSEPDPPLVRDMAPIARVLVDANREVAHGD